MHAPSCRSWPVGHAQRLIVYDGCAGAGSAHVACTGSVFSTKISPVAVQLGRGLDGGGGGGDGKGGGGSIGLGGVRGASNGGGAGGTQVSFFS